MTDIWGRRSFVRLAALAVVELVAAACAPAQQTSPQPAKLADPTTKPAEPTTKPAAPTAQPAGQPGAAAAAKRVTVGYGVQFDMSGPYAHSTNEGYITWAHVMEGLVQYDWQKAAYGPLLAESWSNPTPTTWRFKLRKGVKFHDGSDFTSKDVAHTFNRIRNDPDSKQGASLGAVVKETRVVDDYTVDLETPSIIAPLLSSLYIWHISGKAAYDKYGANDQKSWVGTGPYLFKEYTPGQRFVVSKNPNYWGQSPDFDEMVFRGIPDASARVTALLNGEVDIIDDVPPELLARVTGNARIESIPSLLNFFLVINPIEGAEPLKDVRVRQAIYHAIDRQGLVDGILRGQADPLDSPVGPPFVGYTKTPKVTYDYNPEKAKQLLAQAGYANGFKIEQWTMIDRYPKDKAVSEAINAMLKKVGIDANLKTAEWGVYFGEFVNNGAMPLYLVPRGDAVDPSPYLHQYFQAGVSKRIRGFSSPKVDQLLLKEAATLDPEQRVLALQDAMDAIMEEAPAVFLYIIKDNYGVSNRVDWKPVSERNSAWGTTMKVRN
jgi:peptide/nickel transport system substrate-binding protein